MDLLLPVDAPTALPNSRRSWRCNSSLRLRITRAAWASRCCLSAAPSQRWGRGTPPGLRPCLILAQFFNSFEPTVVFPVLDPTLTSTTSTARPDRALEQQHDQRFATSTTSTEEETNDRTKRSWKSLGRTDRYGEEGYGGEPFEERDRV